MYHSITFGEKNTWDDWRLVSPVLPSFAPPTQKTTYLDIPGASGVIDLSEMLTGYPIFNNREGSFEFLRLNGYESWQDTSMAAPCAVIWRMIGTGSMRGVFLSRTGKTPPHGPP